MKDQVRAMNERYMRAVFVGDCAEEEAVDVYDGKFQLVYMSPEALLTSEK
jgi:superfamily II DNA helicase RecQ